MKKKLGDSLEGRQAERQRKRNRRNGKTVNPSKRYMGDQLPQTKPVQRSADDLIWMNRGSRI